MFYVFDINIFLYFFIFILLFLKKNTFLHIIIYFEMIWVFIYYNIIFFVLLNNSINIILLGFIVLVICSVEIIINLLIIYLYKETVDVKMI